MGISDTLNSLISDWTGVLKGFTFLAAAALVLVVAIVTKLAWGKLIITALVASFVVWAVTMDGLGFFSGTIDREFDTSASSSVVLVIPQPSVAV